MAVSWFMLCSRTSANIRLTSSTVSPRLIWTRSPFTATKNVVLVLAVVLEQANGHHIVVGVMGRSGFLRNRVILLGGFFGGLDSPPLPPLRRPRLQRPLLGLLQDFLRLGSGIHLGASSCISSAGFFFQPWSIPPSMVWGRLPQRAALVVYQAAPLKVEVVSMRT